MSDTLVAMLQDRAASHPARVALTHLRDGEQDAVSWTYGELDTRARRIAASLQAQCAPGDRVLLLYPQGLEFVAALFGCMYAGVLAVPLQPPGRHRAELGVSKLEAIAADGPIVAGCSVGAQIEVLRGLLAGSELAELKWSATDAVDGGEHAWVPPVLAPGDLAYLQYTSGSTSTPKGVMVSHANLLYNLGDFSRGYGFDAHSKTVCWLPSFHDLGLVFGVLMPMFHGIEGVLLDPLHFLRRPLRWLEAISRHGGTHSPAPNFAFDLCVAKSTPEERAALDLRRWKVALNGAEPIRFETEARFVEAFAAVGVTWQTMSHAYGMSESTAKISSEPAGTAPVFLDLDTKAFEQHRVVVVDAGVPGSQRVAGCGQVTGETVVRIVQPDTCVSLPADGVGEIWVGGPTRAGGYYNQPAATEQGFQAVVADTGEGPFLRTGDLGFVHGGQVFVTGRLKDMIILRGENHYPQDLEWSAEHAHPAIRPSCVAAFALGGVDERLALVAEVYPDRLGDPQEVFAALRDAISDHGLSLSRAALVAPRTIHKTSSGKIMRRRTRLSLEAGELHALADWTRPEVPAARVAPPAAGVLDRLQLAAPADRESILVDHVLARAGAILGLPADALDADVPMRELGFDSLQAVDLAEHLSVDLGRPLAETILFDHPTADALARFLLAAASVTAPAAEEEELDGLDDAELAALLEAELDDL